MGSVANSVGLTPAPTSAVAVVSRGASEATVTDWLVLPTWSVTSMVTTSATPTLMFAATPILNPSFFASTLYVPGGTGTRKYPALVALTLDFTLVAVSVIVMAASGITAREGSSTDPVIAPRLP